MIFILCLISFSDLFCSFLSSNKIPQQQISYSIAELEKKYQQEQPMTCDEIQYYSFYKSIRSQDTNYYTQLFWMANFIGMNVLPVIIKKYISPYVDIIVTKQQFKKKIKKKTGITFGHIAGYEETKMALEPLIQNIKNQKKIKKLEKIDGVLLYGPPGCGKTYFVKALAHEMGVPIVSVLMKDLINEEGLIVNKIDLLFEVLYELTLETGPLILFLDEIDFLIGNRSNQNIEQNCKLVLQNFLDKLDGEKKLKGICIVGCTNYRENIDVALLRPGRLGINIEINRPTLKDIISIITLYGKKYNIVFANEEEIFTLANTFVGLTVSEIIKKLQLKKNN
jgi:SpoVK/Ycf46/Vps4 family AAA+-type ATPase